MVVEIGTYRGGTLRCWMHLCDEKTEFVSIDLPGGDFGGGYSDEEARTFRGFLKPGQELHCLRMDSHEAATVNELTAILRGRPIDFLFIDGDHSYEGVKRDYELYRPLVRTGGMIAFHDILPHVVHESCQVHRFWNELRDRSGAFEIIDRDGFDVWGGIGVLRSSRSRSARGEPVAGQGTIHG
jgi:hypothetical protein